MLRGAPPLWATAALTSMCGLPFVSRACAKATGGGEVGQRQWGAGTLRDAGDRMLSRSIDNRMGPRFDIVSFSYPEKNPVQPGVNERKRQMNGRCVGASGVALCMLAATTAARAELPNTIVWTAYQINTAGYGQAVAVGRSEEHTSELQSRE